MAQVAPEQTKQLITAVLLPWQRRYFNAFRSHSRMISICSRQIGKSFISAWCAVYDCIVNGATWTLVSTGQRAADELLNKCLTIARYFEGMLRGTPLHFTFTNNATKIRFSNGAIINSLPNNPDGLRGFSSSLLLDEMAFISNADECWKACIPFLTSPHGAEKKLQIISTPAGQSGKFYELWTKSNYYKTRVTLEDAVREGLPIDIDEIRKTVMDDAVFAQEYMCEFLDNDSALFPYDVLRNAVYTVKPTGGKVYIGIDIGRTHDKTSIAVLREINGVLYIDHVESLTNKEFSYQESYIGNLIKSLNPVKVCIDASGIGANLAENLHRKFATVKEVKFTNETKNEMFTLTRANIGNGKLFIPDDNSLVEDMHKIRRLVSPSGNLTFNASRDDNGHADDATAVALAVYATKKPPQIFMPISGT